ncbi:MAG: ABC transporter ATP-binding protein/permease [Oscillospiraceae bacterium]|nr:ABC transporter ATP-binding protein/permease [Oscillospiraceae bacterium]
MSKFKYYRKAIALSITLKSRMSLIVSILGLGMAFFPMLISLQLAVFSDGAQSLYQGEVAFRVVLISLLVLIGLYIAQTIFSFISSYYSTEDSLRINEYIDKQALMLFSRVPLKYIENHDDFLKRVNLFRAYSGNKATGGIALILNWISNLIAFFSIVFILWLVSPWIVLIILVTCIPAAILTMMQKNETYDNRLYFSQYGNLSLHMSYRFRHDPGQKELRFFGLYPYLNKLWKGYVGTWIGERQKLTRKHTLGNGLTDLLRNGVYLAVIIITAIGIFANPDRGIGSLMLVITAAGQLQSITTRLLVDATGITTDIRYMEDFFVLLETEKEAYEATLQTPYEKADVVFRDVDFCYPNSEKKALDGFNVTIRQGEKIAVVGANGSGKSTFINLLCGLYEPTSGSAEMNGVEISANTAQVRQSVSVVFQNFCKYEDTLRNNINISAPEQTGEDNDAFLAELLQKVGADEVVAEHENALDEMIGVFAESGRNLSGGQWQKISIARALYRRHACMYILDEPTAALDPISEARIYRNFAELTGDKTTILISHRLGITSVVDRILVFDEGKIVEDGSHEELMGQGGLYADMYKAQAKWYVE